MKRDEAISRLKQHEADLKRLGVEHLYMFGSTARRLRTARGTCRIYRFFSVALAVFAAGCFRGIRRI